MKNKSLSQYYTINYFFYGVLEVNQNYFGYLDTKQEFFNFSILYKMIKPISITPKALQEIKYILQHKNIPQGYGLRVLVQGGAGCGGAQFRLGFDTQKDGDAHFMVQDVTVYYEKRQLMFLVGKQIDFEERTDERGFIFRDETSLS